MKGFILVLTFFIMFMLSVKAEATEAPKYLKGAEITVTLKNGKTYTFKSEEYAVVPRNGMGQVVVLQNQLASVAKKIERKELVKNKKNRIYGLIGRGNTGGLDTSTNGSRYETTQDVGTVGGIGYQRKLNETINAGVQVQNNGTTSLSLGLDF